MANLRLLLFLVGLVLGQSILSPALAEQPVTLGQKAALQAAMQHHIQRNLVNGVYLQVDFKSGAVRGLHPASVHPTILEMGKYFVLCSDFRDNGGKTVNVDFYLAPRGKGYSVFQTVIGDRGTLMKLMKMGRVKPVS